MVQEDISCRYVIHEESCSKRYKRCIKIMIKLMMFLILYFLGRGCDREVISECERKCYAARWDRGGRGYLLREILERRWKCVGGGIVIRVSRGV